MENVIIKGSIKKSAKIILLGGTVGAVCLAFIFLLINCSLLNYWRNYDYEHRYRYSPFYFEHSYICLGFGLIAILLGITYWMMCKMQIIVTDKRVTGKASFGKTVDLPMDSISAVGSSIFKGIAVSTASGVIRFFFIENAEIIRKEICNLLLQRQEIKKEEDKKGNHIQGNSADELKKYKELADEGIITQEEFEQKKKQLLGL